MAAELRYAVCLRQLPSRVALFQWRAHRLARRTGEPFSLDSATRPGNLAVLLGLAGGRRLVVELGTATAWTAFSLALADPERQVISYDPYEHPERERYLGLVDADTRRRVRFVAAAGDTGPGDERRPVQMLYIDSSHDRDQTIAEVNAWRPALAAGAVVVFDDYDHLEYPGVREAVEALGLSGDRVGSSLFVHRPDRACARACPGSL